MYAILLFLGVASRWSIESKSRLVIMRAVIHTSGDAYLRKKGPAYWKTTERTVPTKSRLYSVSDRYKSDGIKYVHQVE